MRKITAVLLCVFLLTMLSVTAFAAEPQTSSGQAVITTTVPDTHKVVIYVTGNVTVTLDGEPGEKHIVGRLSQPVLEIKAKDRKIITRVLLNGDDITDMVKDGEYVLPPVYQDELLDIYVETKKAEQSAPSEPESSAPDTSKPESSVPDTNKPTPGTDPAKTGDFTPTAALFVIGIISILTAALLYRNKKEKD